MSFYIHTDACTDINVGMGIGISIPEAMISKSTIDKLASVDDREILTLRDSTFAQVESLGCRKSVAIRIKRNGNPGLHGHSHP